MKINIVLFKPEIPANTANIIRTCVGLDAKLHLIKPYGFDLQRDHPQLKRSSANYMEEVELYEYESFDDFKKKQGNNINMITKFGTKNYVDITLEEEIYIMFGSESTGIDKEITDENQENLYRIPMMKEMRSLNLSNCVALVGYDIARRNNFERLK